MMFGGVFIISFVIPVYNEEKTLQKNICEIVSYLKNIEYEIIIVDDGSLDKTWNIINILKCQNNNIKGIKFSRNFGKEAALLAGVSNANGDAIITMDSDLQHHPKYINEMIKKWQEGYKIVDCIKKKRQKESLFYKLCATIFYKTMKKLINIDMTNSGDYKLLDRQVVNEIIKLNDSGLFFRGMVNFVGFETYRLEIEIQKREGDTTKFNFKSLSKLAVNAITFFSTKPLSIPIEFAIYNIVLAVCLFILSIFIDNDLIINFKYLPYIVELLISSTILFSLGIIGLYIGKMFEQTKNRPRYIIEKII